MGHTLSEEASTPPFLLHAHGIRKSFSGVEVLRGVDVTVAGGQVVALLGENGAGKSTLTRILSGAMNADEGTITVDGTGHAQLNPVMARRLGIRMIHQEMHDAPTLSVAENVMLGALTTSAGFVNWRRVRREAKAALQSLNVDLELDRPVGTLRVGERQAVEIARALTGHARCLIMDEPTAALSDHEVESLFELVRELRRRGIAIVHITHRLDEVEAIADEVVIMRDGEVITDGLVVGFSRAKIISLMSELDDSSEPQLPPVDDGFRPEVPSAAGAAEADGLLTLRGAASGEAFRDVDLNVRPGEVLVLYGKLGSGTAEVAEVAIGVRQLTSGALALAGEEVRLSGPRHAINCGVGFLPADRKREGSFLSASVAANMSAPSWPDLSRGGFLSQRVQNGVFARWQDKLAIKASGGAGQTFETLSGGNQQKALIARWLERDCRVLALIEPTRGVDITGRHEIHQTIRSAADQGAAVLIVTSDIEEAVQIADRAVVMSRGRIVARIDSRISAAGLMEATA